MEFEARDTTSNASSTRLKVLEILAGLLSAAVVA
jgi:hypothetical protein